MYILVTKVVSFSKIAFSLWYPLVNKGLFLCNILDIHLTGHIKIRFSTQAALITQTLSFNQKVMFYSCYRLGGRGERNKNYWRIYAPYPL